VRGSASVTRFVWENVQNVPKISQLWALGTGAKVEPRLNHFRKDNLMKNSQNLKVCHNLEISQGWFFPRCQHFAESGRTECVRNNWSATSRTMTSYRSYSDWDNQGWQMFLGTIYQNRKKYTKWPCMYVIYQMAKNTPNGRKIDQMVIKFTNIFLCQTLQNVPKLGFLVSKFTIWQPWI
jgi:hypothetical protein